MKALWPLAALALAGCVSVGVGDESASHTELALHDGALATVARRAEPLVGALLVQAQPASALADTTSIAYTRHADAYAYYQLSSWTERPARAVPRLLQQRLEARGVAGAVGQVGDPLRADWLLAVGIDVIDHDLRSTPGTARFALTADLYDRRTRARVAHRSFSGSAPAARADAPAAVEAMSVAVSRTFDELQPWLEGELRRAAAAH